MKKTLFKMILSMTVMLIHVTANGQTYISYTTAVKSTITRCNDDGSRRMHYLNAGNNSGYFLSTFTSGLNNYYFTSHQISGYNITDFTMFNDTLYFCGEDEDHVGTYGWSSAVGNNWVFHIYKLHNNVNASITNVRRIKVFRSGADLNVLLIGDYERGGYLPQSSIIHVKNNDTTCTLAYSALEYFEDVAILDNYVVTIQRKGGKGYPTEPHYLRMLNKSNLSLYDVLFDNYKYWSIIESVGHVWLQRVSGDGFVSVYRNDTAYFFNTYSVLGGNISSHNYSTVMTGYMPTIEDVAYNGYDSTLVILHNSDLSGTAAYYDCSSFPNVSLSSARYIVLFNSSSTNVKLTSLAKSTTQGFYITGMRVDNPVFWNAQNSLCNLIIDLPFTTVPTIIKGSKGLTVRNTLPVHHSTYLSQAGNLTVNLDCATTPFMKSNND